MSEERKPCCLNCRKSWACKEFKEQIGNYNMFDNEYMEIETSHVCDDFKSKYIEYPITVNEIEHRKPTHGISYRSSDIGKFCKIRPCADEYKGKTYLGIYLGDLPISNTVFHNEESGKLTLGMRTNPAIFVFDLKKIVYGMESWWGIIESEEHLKDISDNDIHKVWYVKLLKQIGKDNLT